MIHVETCSNTYSAHFSELGEHDHNGGIMLPQHSPEVLGGLRQRALRGYVGLLLPAEKEETIIRWRVQIRPIWKSILSLTFLLGFEEEMKGRDQKTWTAVRAGFLLFGYTKPFEHGELFESLATVFWVLA